jgi:NAD(P)-dependent dehydrogenase (short-subunit alcohol dehydrogenase family)
MTSSRFTGKTAIITGGGQGIGRAIAARFLQEGAAVVLAEIDAAVGEDAARRLEPAAKVRFVQTDVSDEEAVRRMVALAIDIFGRIDCLINNAAIGRGAKVTELALADWQRVIGVNLTGPFLCAKHAAPHLSRMHGAIVNIASTRALMSEPNSEAYTASKGGLVALTHALAASLGPEVRVNCIAPGWIDTRDVRASGTAGLPPLRDRDHAQHFAGRVGIPDDIAALALFLCSSDSGFITGQNFIVDGGMTRKLIYVE